MIGFSPFMGAIYYKIRNIKIYNQMKKIWESDHSDS